MASPEQGRVDYNNTALREKPEATSPILSALSVGQMVEVLDRSSNPGFTQVRADDLVGWVASVAIHFEAARRPASAAFQPPERVAPPLPRVGSNDSREISTAPTGAARQGSRRPQQELGATSYPMMAAAAAFMEILSYITAAIILVAGLAIGIAAGGAEGFGSFIGAAVLATLEVMLMKLYLERGRVLVDISLNTRAAAIYLQDRD